MAIYTIRTTSGREDIVIDLLIKKLENTEIDIKSIFHPAEIKGYIFVEAAPGNVHKIMQGLMHIRGMIEKPVKLEEIQHFLESKKTRIAVSMGDVVEIIGGPFKGEKGKITRIDKVKEEITIELLEASIPIPVTVSVEFVKIIKKSAQKEEESEQKEEEFKSTGAFENIGSSDTEKDSEEKQ
ncbi:MAG: transcription elongation factor Spt5 [Nanoarchaeota archaeon]|nr:transcription elongation factor Spt5 [Nanoarchaeota archaeon]MBU1135173.1 transcription elongation factor Spt5 [Nanoarchaeota archaeon]MBU2520526.1 transcription elongation factor Spt5 [Nanoarchaeota archaeon]